MLLLEARRTLSPPPPTLWEGGSSLQWEATRPISGFSCRNALQATMDDHDWCRSHKTQQQLGQQFMAC